MDSDNPVVNLCLKGIQAEFEGRKNEACKLYLQAWNAATDEFDACIAAHYVARCQVSPIEILYWNRLALEQAEAVKDDRAKDFYPSLYLNMGRSYELLGDQTEAQRYYDIAAGLGVPHQLDFKK